jgi:hypothetical protein
MIYTSKDELSALSKNDLWLAALNKDNSRDIQDAALQMWMAIDDRDYENSIQNMRALLDKLRTDTFSLNDKFTDFPDFRKSA